MGHRRQKQPHDCARFSLVRKKTRLVARESRVAEMLAMSTPAGANDAWPETTIAMLRLMWDDGLSTAAIARRLGKTKSSVCGKAHRLDLPGRPSPIKGEMGITRRARARQEKIELSRSIKLEQLPSLTIMPPAPPKPKRSIRAAAEQTIFASHQFPPKRECLFPFGVVRTREFRFCGKRVAVPGPYCDACRKKAYVSHRVDEAA